MRKTKICPWCWKRVRVSTEGKLHFHKAKGRDCHGSWKTP